MLGGGVEIVIVGGDAGLLELAGCLVGQLPQGHAHLHAEFFHVPDNLENGCKLGLSLADALPGGPHAEAPGSGSLGLTGLGEDGLAIHQPFGFHAGVVAGALGTVGAVLAASAGLDAEEAAKLNPFAFPPMGPLRFPGLFQQIEKGLAINSRKFGESFGGRGPQ